jgi:tetratricopeptide (TPR) repeat protein
LDETFRALRFGGGSKRTGGGLVEGEPGTDRSTPPDAVGSAVQRAREARDAGRWREAYDFALQALAADPRDPEAQSLVYRTINWAGIPFSEQCDVADCMQAADPDSFAARAIRRWAHLFVTGEDDLADLEEVAESGAPASLVHRTLAIAYAVAGRVAEAETAESRLRQVEDDAITLDVVRAEVLQAQGKRAAAARLLEASIERAPQRPDLRGQLAWVQMSRGKTRGALLQAREATRLAPDAWSAWYTLAAAADQPARPVESRRAAVKSLELAGPFPTGYLLYGRACRRQGDVEAASQGVEWSLEMHRSRAALFELLLIRRRQKRKSEARAIRAELGRLTLSEFLQLPVVGLVWGFCVPTAIILWIAGADAASRGSLWLGVSLALPWLVLWPASTGIAARAHDSRLGALAVAVLWVAFLAPLLPFAAPILWAPGPFGTVWGTWVALGAVLGLIAALRGSTRPR